MNYMIVSLHKKIILGAIALFSSLCIHGMNDGYQRYTKFNVDWKNKVDRADERYRKLIPRSAYLTNSESLWRAAKITGGLSIPVGLAGSWISSNNKSVFERCFGIGLLSGAAVLMTIGATHSIASCFASKTQSSADLIHGFRETRARFKEESTKLQAQTKFIHDLHNHSSLSETNSKK